MSPNQFFAHKRAKDKLKELFSRVGKVYAIHYSCESFYERDDWRSPRITSVAVRNLESGQTTSFSIHLVAELRDIPVSEIDSHYDELEREMLDRLAEYLKARRDATWIHWNMRDQNYGFQAIEHRHRILKGEPEVVPDDRKIDLSSLLISLYGENYIGHPRLASLVAKNKISTRDFMDGGEEAIAFMEKRYLDLHRSTLRKAYILCSILRGAYDEDLVTNSSWKDKLGSSLRAKLYVIKEHPAYDVVTIGGVILAAVLGVFDLLDILGPSVFGP